MAKENKILTPQQILFLESYTNPKSEFFGNARQSALKAGYTETYADNITDSMPSWLLENVGSMKMLDKAERNLNEVQDLTIRDENGKVLTDVLRERNKIDIFVAGTIGKNKYSTKGDDAMTKIADKIEAINYIMPNEHNHDTPNN